MTSRDCKELARLIDAIKTQDNQTWKPIQVSNPLDNDIVQLLENLHTRIESRDEYGIFSELSIVYELWEKLIEKSIICLRYYDKREPFLEISDTRPVAHGINELKDYFYKYSEFENLLYGGNNHYRDHVIHMVRVWILGMNCLMDTNGPTLYMRLLELENHRLQGSLSSVNQITSVDPIEKVCIWTIIALTHDLGYPLEKAQGIVEKTKDMTRLFITNPVIDLNLAFSGAQDRMNDYIVRFISSKMHEASVLSASGSEKPKKQEFVVRLQPKYYFKFQKSLEKCAHGIVSAILVYKMLLFFLESDFSLNEDYRFGAEDVRQYYIRREILRAIAAHTCKDIYHLSMFSFSFLLIIVDDAQNWGRKRIKELYVPDALEFDLQSVAFEIKSVSESDETQQEYGNLILKETVQNVTDKEALSMVMKDFVESCEGYAYLFRDGKETILRDFELTRTVEVSATLLNCDCTITATYFLPQKGAPYFTIEVPRDRLTQNDWEGIFSNKYSIEGGEESRTGTLEYTIVSR